MILTLKQDNLSYSFAITQEGFADSYTVSYYTAIQDMATLTHFAQAQWKGSRMDDVVIDLDLFVGALGFDDSGGIVTAIEDSRKLVSVIESLYTWSLPKKVSGHSGILDVIQLSISDGKSGSYWYFRQYLIRNIKSKFLPPWDVGNDGGGRPMRAKVSLTLMPHLFSTTANEIDQTKLPKRDGDGALTGWHFDELW